MTVPAVLESRALSQPEQAATLAVVDQLSLDAAGAFLLGVKGLQKEIEDHHREPKQKAHAAWRSIIAAEARLLDPLQRAETIVKPKIRAYLDECERKRREEEARLADAERKRQEETQLQAALQAESLGVSDEDVSAILDEKPVLVAVALPPTYEPVKGISGRETWSAEVTSLMELVKAVAGGRAPIQAVEANMAFLGQQARALKNALAYPGVRAVVTKSVAARTR